MGILDINMDWKEDVINVLKMYIRRFYMKWTSYNIQSKLFTIEGYIVISEDILNYVVNCSEDELMKSSIYFKHNLNDGSFDVIVSNEFKPLNCWKTKNGQGSAITFENILNYLEHYNESRKPWDYNFISNRYDPQGL